jgi:hypothetical protein
VPSPATQFAQRFHQACGPRSGASRRIRGEDAERVSPGRSGPRERRPLRFASGFRRRRHRGRAARCCPRSRPAAPGAAPITSRLRTPEAPRRTANVLSAHGGPARPKRPAGCSARR